MTDRSFRIQPWFSKGAEKKPVPYVRRASAFVSQVDRIPVRLFL